MFPAHVFLEMVSYVGAIVGSCERGDAYSEAKSISELCALAYSSVASQYITWFQLLNPICFPGDGFIRWCDRRLVRAWRCLQRSEKHLRTMRFSV